MSYEIRGSSVAWTGKVLKGITPDTFELLDNDLLARAGDAILMRGKPVAVNADSFALLSGTYARDDTSVFQIMQATLKPLPKADAATFEVAGGRFGRDKNTAWFEAKPVKGADHTALRALDDRYATDGTLLFFEHKKFGSPKDYKVDLRKARMRVQAGQYTDHDFIIQDENGAYFVQAFDRPSVWVPIETDAPHTLRFLRTSDAFRRSSVWLSDGQHVLWRGRKLCGAHPDTVALLSDTVAKTPDQVFVAGLPAPEMEATSLCHLEGAHYADAAALWTLRSGWTWGGDLRTDKDRLVTRTSLALDPDAAIAAFFTAAIADLLAMLDVMEGDGGLKSTNPAQSVEADPATLSQLSVTRSGSTVSVLLGAQEASGEAGDWYRIGCRLWAQSHDRPVTLFHYPRHDGMTGTYLQDIIWQRHRGEMLLAVQGFADLGHQDAAQHLACQALVEIFGRGRSILQEQDVDVLAQVDPKWLQYAGLPLFYGAFNARTYLAGARRAMDRDGLTDPDVRTRWGAIAFLHYMIKETGQPKHFLAEILPPIVAMLDTEKVGFVRDLALGALDTACDRFSLKRFDLHAACVPYIERLIDEQVNTEQNRARLEGEVAW